MILQRRSPAFPAATRLETRTLAGFPSRRNLRLAAAIRAAHNNCLLRMDPRLYRVNGLQTNLACYHRFASASRRCIRRDTGDGGTAFSFMAAGLTGHG